jgi:hypothetical protein
MGEDTVDGSYGRRRKAVVVLGEWRSTSHIDPL